MVNTASPSDVRLQAGAGESPQRQLTPVDQSFTLRFWGVRGNVPAPGPDTVRYGGNTACVEVLVGGQRLIFDGGTGLRVLGHHLTEQGQPIKAHLFFTHTHKPELSKKIHPCEETLRVPNATIPVQCGRSVIRVP